MVSYRFSFQACIPPEPLEGDSLHTPGPGAKNTELPLPSGSGGQPFI